MNMRSVVSGGILVFVILFAQASTAVAADVKLISGFGMRPVLDEIVPQFERATGHKLTVQYGSTAEWRRQIEAGHAFDIAITTPALVDDLAKQGKIAAETRTMIARSAMGVAVRAGAPRPDIRSVETFKRTLLNAKSFAYAPEGTTGTHVAKVFERLGIAGEMKAKAKLQRNVASVNQALADGEAELGFGVMSSLASARGVDVVGLFPPEFQDYVVYVAGVSATAKDKQAAKALVDFLRKESAASVMRAKGLEPVAP